MKALKLIQLLMLGGLVVITLSSCDIFNPDDDEGGMTDPVAGDTLWIHESPAADSMIIGPSLALGQNGDLYYAVTGYTSRWNNSKIVAIDADDASVKWISDKMDHQTGISSPIVVGDDNTLYVIGYTTLYAFDHNTGTTLWTWTVPENLPNPDNPQQMLYTFGQIHNLALTDDGNLLLSSGASGGSYARAVFCIDPNGNKLWHNIKVTDWGVTGGIVIGANNTAFFYTDIAGVASLVAVDVSTGNVKWSKERGTVRSSANRIAIQEDGNLFCAFAPAGESVMKYHIINATDGSTLWISSEKAEGYEKWIGPDGKLYEGPAVYQVDASSGARTSVVTKANMGAITSANRLATGFTDADWLRKLGVFYPDGLMDYNVRMEGLLGDQMVISNDGVIFGRINLHPVSLLPTKICAIQGDSPLANSGWPTTYHDNRNTSNLNKF